MENKDRIFEPIMTRVPSVVSEVVNNMDEETKLQLKHEINIKTPDKSIDSDQDSKGDGYCDLDDIEKSPYGQYKLELPVEMHTLDADHNGCDDDCSEKSYDLTEVSAQASLLA